MRQQQHLRAVLVLQLRLKMLQFQKVIFFPAKHRQNAVFQQILELIPGAEAEEHIRAHHQVEGVLRVLTAQQLNGVGAVAPALPAHLQAGHLRPGDFLKGQAAQRKARFRIGAALRHVLMGRDVGGNDEKTIRLQLLIHRPGGADMAQVGRVEAAAVNGCFHFFLSLMS